MPRCSSGSGRSRPSIRFGVPPDLGPSALVDGLVVNRSASRRHEGGGPLVPPNLSSAPSARPTRRNPRPTDRTSGGDRHDQGDGRRLRLGLPRGRVDWHSNKVVGHLPACRPAPGTGWCLGPRRKPRDPAWHRGQSLNPMADNGCQPTRSPFAGLRLAGIRQAFTSYSNPKGNADTERFLRTLKEELVGSRRTSPASFSSPRALARQLQRRLSALGAGLPLTRGIRSRTSRPRHSPRRCLLNGVQYNLHSALGYRRAQCRRSRASRPRHSLSRGLLNGVQYTD